MKSTKYLLLIFLVLISLNINAQETISETINVATAGSLPSLIPSSKKNQITNLTLTGFLNGTDFGYIRDMARDGILSVLDLSKAQIVAGGEAYIGAYGDRYTSLNSIGNYLFYGCIGLTSITIPNSVTTIGDYAFDNCRGLTSITIPNGVTTIGENAFGACTGLTSVTIPNSVATIGKQAFSNCPRLTSVTIPNGVTTIGVAAFFNCTGLTSIAFPNSVTTIGGWLFSGCTGLTSITIPSSVTTIGDYAFENCAGLTSVTLPNSVTTIGVAAFFRCTGLTSITIPNGVITVGNDAFRSCTGLTSVTIPNSLITIGDEVFGNCYQIKQIYCKGTTPPNIDPNTFLNIYNTCKLYVPKGAYSVYRAAPCWGDFIDIIEEVTTSMSDIEVSYINVYAENGSIIVKDAKLGDIVDIYSVSGSLLHKIKITDEIIRINVASQNCYIVKAGDRSFKIAL